MRSARRACPTQPYLPASVVGRWFHLYLILDLYSRKIVGFEVHDTDDGEHAAHLAKRTALAEGNGGGVGATDCGDGTSVESGCAEELMPEFTYTAVPARFWGLEASGSQRLLDGSNKFDLEWRADLVRAVNLASGQPLPRIAPLRVGAALAWSRGPWGARVGADHWAAQRRVPAGELTTGSYTLWSAGLTYRSKVGPASLLWHARLENATDRLAYSATSLLTQTAPGRVPLPGRSLRVGVQALF